MFTRPRIIPVLSIDDGSLVKTRRFSNARYLGDPVNAVKIFNIKGADEMAVLDIRASVRGTEPDYEMLKDIASQAFMPLSYGGGIQTASQAAKLFSIGYEKVIVNTAFFKNAGLIRELSDTFGSQSVAVSIDTRKKNGQYYCAAMDGRKNTGKTAADMAKLAEQKGAGEIIINSIDQDGMMHGYDLELIKEVSSGINIPVIACGGAGTVKDLKKALDAGAHAVAAGSMFVFYGKLRAVLINMPSEKELLAHGIYGG